MLDPSTVVMHMLLDAEMPASVAEDFCYDQGHDLLDLLEVALGRLAVMQDDYWNYRKSVQPTFEGAISRGSILLAQFGRGYQYPSMANHRAKCKNKRTLLRLAGNLDAGKPFAPLV